MNILVLVKNVPETVETELKIVDRGRSVETDELVFSINEWDNYAVEEAVALKEVHGGQVTLLTLGDEEAEDVLRRGLAMGADQAVHICDEDLEGSDPRTVAQAVKRALDGREFDLILSGAQSSDLGQAQTGVLLAQLLDLPYATLAVGLEVKDGKAMVERELEANTLERVELPLPALITIQSGINQPRYVSILGIRKVRKMTIDLLEADDLDLDPDEIGFEGSIYEERSLSLPPQGEGAEMLEGSLNQVCSRMAEIIREKGGLK